MCIHVFMFSLSAYAQTVYNVCLRATACNINDWQYSMIQLLLLFLLFYFLCQTAAFAEVTGANCLFGLA